MTKKPTYEDLEKKIRVLQEKCIQGARAEEALKLSEEKFRLLIENAPDAIYVHADGEFIYLNGAAVDLFGAERAEQLLGAPIADRFHPDFHAIIARRLDDLYGERKKLSVIEQIYLRLDGSSVPVEAHAIPITYHGRNAALTFVRDITERKRAEESLESERNLLRNLIDNLPDRIYAKDAEGRFIICNEAMMRRMGKTSMDDVVGMSDFDFLAPEMAQRFRADEEAILRTGVPMINREEPLAAEGDQITRWNLATKVPLLDRQGNRIGIVGVGREITGLKQAEEALCSSREIAERLAEEMAIMAEIGRLIGSTLDLDEVYERFAAEARKLIPFDRIVVNLNRPDERYCAYVSGVDVPERRPGDSFPLAGTVNDVIAGTRTGLILHPATVEEIARTFPSLVGTFQAGLRSLMSVPLISRDEVIGVLHFRSKKPDAYSEQDLRLAERIGAQIAGAIANAQLFKGLRKTEKSLRESEERYRELSILDELTQLYNSRFFYQQLKCEFDRVNRYGEPLTLLLLDIDDFKAFNDTFGHVEGDQVLRQFGQVIKRCIRRTDSGYRYGGEEFTVILPMTTSGDGAAVADRIRTEFKKELFPPAAGKSVHMTTSIGIAQLKEKEEMKSFIQRVDQHMYRAKQNGKDRCCAEP